MKVRHVAKRNSQSSRVSAFLFDSAFDWYWHPSRIEGGWDDEDDFRDDGGANFQEGDDDCWYDDPRDEDADDEVDVDTCVACGRAYGPHAGLSAWSRDNGVAPQLCHRCWKAHGYRYPEPA